jgi:hypothetical protein
MLIQLLETFVSIGGMGSPNAYNIKPTLQVLCVYFDDDLRERAEFERTHDLRARSGQSTYRRRNPLDFAKSVAKDVEGDLRKWGLKSSLNKIEVHIL